MNASQQSGNDRPAGIIVEFFKVMCSPGRWGVLTWVFMFLALMMFLGATDSGWTAALAIFCFFAVPGLILSIPKKSFGGYLEKTMMWLGSIIAMMVISGPIMVWGEQRQQTRRDQERIRQEAEKGGIAAEVATQEYTALCETGASLVKSGNFDGALNAYQSALEIRNFPGRPDNAKSGVLICRVMLGKISNEEVASRIGPMSDEQLNQLLASKDLPNDLRIWHDQAALRWSQLLRTNVQNLLKQRERERQIAREKRENEVKQLLVQLGSTKPEDLKRFIRIFGRLHKLLPENEKYEKRYRDLSNRHEQQQRELRFAKELAAHKLAARKKLIGKQFYAWDGSHNKLTEYIKSSMNDPGSFVHVKTVYRDLDKYLLVTMTFRGKNAFGGTVTNTVTAKVNLDGQVLEIL